MKPPLDTAPPACAPGGVGARRRPCGPGARAPSARIVPASDGSRGLCGSVSTFEGGAIVRPASPPNWGYASQPKRLTDSHLCVRSRRTLGETLTQNVLVVSCFISPEVSNPVIHLEENRRDV